MDGTKVCHRCVQTQPIGDFPFDKKAKGGRSNRCKKCAIACANRHYRSRRAAEGKSYRPLKRESEWRALHDAGAMQCLSCGQVKPIADFRCGYREPYRRRLCRECERLRCARQNRIMRAQRQEYSRRYRCKLYGITVADFDRMVKEQNSACAVCGRALGERLQTIDHDHRTGRVRGIVHSQCNLVLGNAREDVAVLEGAIAYLKRHTSQEAS